MYVTCVYIYIYIYIYIHVSLAVSLYFNVLHRFQKSVRSHPGIPRIIPGTARVNGLWLTRGVPKPRKNAYEKCEHMGKIGKNWET